MKLVDARTGVEVIDLDGCLRLLATQSIGRVAVQHGGRPICLPVNYVLDGECIIFRTAAGTKLDAAVRGAPVAFEVDSTDAVLQAGWSVMVAGRAEEVVHPDELARVEALPLRSWAPSEKHHWVVIEPDTITGRRLRADFSEAPPARH
jgi:nitroimidazol reductase NimA-like FMN-containing flavoprotein (pyridoxamine 5'-phosphate oxidase superfamily)